MPNVYDLIERYYAGLPEDTPPFLPKELVERYLRKRAWQGMGDAALKREWHVLAILMENGAKWEVPTLEYFSIVDYQEIFYQCVERGDWLELDEPSLEQFFRSLSEFAAFCLGEDADPLLCHLQAAKESFYVLGEFLPPTRQGDDDFYSVLERQDAVDPEDMDRLNEILDGLLAKLGEYFHQDRFMLDLTRAIMLYGGPDYDPGEEPDEEAQQDFYFNFWDYFLFDYHLSESDLTPLAYYYRHERETLPFTEDSIIRDLLGARFTVFCIESIEEDAVLCRDIFTEEQMELPLPDTLVPDYRKVAFMGHVHRSGVMLLNYIVPVPASKKLQRRMKHEVMRQYELFRYQQPDATLAEFFAREAAAVRQVIRILTEYAQLNVVPIKSYPRPVQAGDALPPGFRKAGQRLEGAGRKAGLSLYALGLLRKFYADYVLVSEETEEQKQGEAALAATLCMFGKVNGMGNADLKDFVRLFRTTHFEVRRKAASLRQALQCEPFDPRYLTEEGFLQMLYAE